MFFCAGKFCTDLPQSFVFLWCKVLFFCTGKFVIETGMVSTQKMQSNISFFCAEKFCTDLPQSFVFLCRKVLFFCAETKLTLFNRGTAKKQSGFCFNLFLNEIYKNPKFHSSIPDSAPPGRRSGMSQKRGRDGTVLNPLRDMFITSQLVTHNFESPISYSYIKSLPFIKAEGVD